MRSVGTTQLVVPFDRGSAADRDLLGGKGANLAEMHRLGLPVPLGFIVTTEACRRYLAEGRVPAGLFDEVARALKELEDTSGRRLGDPQAPLLLSVRSGAAFSMPGMMDTVLNLGATPETIPGLIAMADERFAWDATRRFLEMYGRVVLGVDEERFGANLDAAVGAAGVEHERDLTADQLQRVVDAHRRSIVDAGAALPDDPREQLRLAVEAVFRSWVGTRARAYRRVEGIPDDLGTAVTIQTMVFGNLNDRSATGVAFTRDPATGEPVAYGDFLVGAQGEDVVAGTRKVEHLSGLAVDFPEQHAELMDHLHTLEKHYLDLCDVEFTIENDRLWMLQTRVGKRSAAAALRIAVDLVDEGMIEEDEALTRIRPRQLEQLLHPRFGPDAPEPLTAGLAASPGAAVGAICLSSDEAKQRGLAGEDVILVRPETSPEDLEGMIASVGLLTSRGGLVSHAAVVARGFGKPAVCGASELQIDPAAGEARVGEAVVRAGDVIAISGTTGEVVLGEIPLVTPEPTGPFAIVLGWADEFRRLGVRANADLPDDAVRARELGAEGIGLCRTEHMFLGERLPIVQRMILAATEDEERAALAELLAVQRDDFAAIYRAMDGLPVTVRLLDPPLHEFLPDVEELLVASARGALDADGRRLLDAAVAWREDNPMLGTRGCRLGIIKPELYRMQVRALLEAAVEVTREGVDPRVEIMVPLVVSREELALIAGWIEEVADEVLAGAGVDVPCRVGTMIETPRAVLLAGEIAEAAEFFSFGTNDLTQMTFGFSRDDVEGRIMPAYLRERLLLADPFEHLDAPGVGRLVRLAVDEGRAARGDLHVGVCGEHGGDPESIRFCHEVGLDYVSCSPFRVPVARLAAAHAALGHAGPEASA
jgi:pyruvate, orthophosphate dikinase